MQLTKFCSLIPLSHGRLGREREDGCPHYPQLFSSLLSARRMYGWSSGGVQSNTASGWVTILETKGLIRPEEGKLSLSWEKRIGEKPSARTAIKTADNYDKAAEIACQWPIIVGPGGVGKCNRGAAVQHSTCADWLVAQWPLTLRGCMLPWESGARSEQVQAWECMEAWLWYNPARPLLNSVRLRAQIKHFLSIRFSPPGFSHWLFAHYAMTWLPGSAENFLVDDSPKSKVNTVLSSCKLNNLVRK